MLEAGLLEEVRAILSQGYSSASKALQSIGYKQMAAVVDGRMSREEAMREMKRDTRRFAKRQMTWFRHDPEIAWFMLPGARQEIAERIKNFLKQDIN
jgi:tRNA dimethylallyltransferase